jgi:hypothetical protein
LPAVRTLLLLPERAGAAPRLALETHGTTPNAVWVVLREPDGTRWSVAVRNDEAPTRVGDLDIDARAAVVRRATGSRQPELRVFGGRHAQPVADA